MKISIKRIYEPPSPDDGTRILVDRMWPRAVSKDKAQLDHWWKEMAPSSELRKWYGHELEKWEAFKRKYQQELQRQKDIIREKLDELAGTAKVTLLYGARDKEHNQAVVLREFLQLLVQNREK